MTFPTTPINTTNVDESTDDPSLARTDILAAFTALNTIIDEANDANGVCVLNGSGLVDGNKLPQSITLTAGVQIINPVSGIVNIQDILRLTSRPTTDILDITTSTLTQGDITISSDGGTSATMCVVVFDGVFWRKIQTDGILT